MRLNMGRSLIVFIWTEEQYRIEIVRLFQGINRRLLRLVRAWKVLGLRVVVVQRVPPDGGAESDQRAA